MARFLKSNWFKKRNSLFFYYPTTSAHTNVAEFSLICGSYLTILRDSFHYVFENTLF